MKIRHYWILIPATLFLLAFSCENKEDPGLTESEKQIIGQWTWVESTYYYTVSGIPYVMNPDTLGSSMQVSFNEDGTFIAYRNDLQESSGTYWFEAIKYDDGTESALRLFTREDDYVKSVNFTLSEDTLILDETDVDGAKRVFHKSN